MGFWHQGLENEFFYLIEATATIRNFPVACLGRVKFPVIAHVQYSNHMHMSRFNHITYILAGCFLCLH